MDRHKTPCRTSGAPSHLNQWALFAPQLASRHLVLRNLAARVERAVREHVGAAPSRPVVRDEDSVRAYGAHYHGLERDGAAARRDGHLVAGLDAVARGERGMKFQLGSGVL